MGKLSLKANPTFQVKVGVPVAGGEPVPVLFTFKHRTKSGLEEFVKSRADKTDIESFMDMVTAWDLEDEFNTENITELLENHAGTAMAVVEAYIHELVNHKAKN